jgi:hypothetical protein
MRWKEAILTAIVAGGLLVPAWGLAGPGAPQRQDDDAARNSQYPYNAPGRLSPSDQGKFDKYYSKWMDATRRNDRDDIEKNARHMQDIMAHYNISPNVPFDQIASNGAAYRGNGGAYQGAYPGAYQNNGYPGQARLSPDDQQKFDHYYSKWVDAQRKNDRDDVEKNARHMADIMAHYNIPANVPFDQIASSGAGYGARGTYPSAYPGAYGPGRLSSDDQKDFDKNYSKWVDARRRNDSGDADRAAQHMRDIMARNNIPANVPFDRIASPGVGARY